MQPSKPSDDLSPRVRLAFALSLAGGLDGPSPASAEPVGLQLSARTEGLVRDLAGDDAQLVEAVRQALATISPGELRPWPYRPSVIWLENEKVHQAVYDRIMKSDPDQRKDLYLLKLRWQALSQPSAMAPAGSFAGALEELEALAASLRPVLPEGAMQFASEHPHLMLIVLGELIRSEILKGINLEEHPRVLHLVEVGEELSDVLRLPPGQLLIRWFNHERGQHGPPAGASGA